MNPKFKQFEYIQCDLRTLNINFIEKRIMASDTSSHLVTGDIAAIEIRYVNGALSLDIEITHKVLTIPDFMTVLREAPVEYDIPSLKRTFEAIVNSNTMECKFIPFGVLIWDQVNKLTWFDHTVDFISMDDKHRYDIKTNLGELLTAMQVRLHYIASQLSHMKPQGYRQSF